MTDVKEQRICIKFYLNPGKTAAETQKMLKEAFDDIALGLTKRTNGLGVSKTDGCQSTMTSILDDLRQEPRPKMWQKCERLSWKTEG
jgi:hypothetical protein